MRQPISITLELATSLVFGQMKRISILIGSLPSPSGQIGGHAWKAKYGGHGRERCGEENGRLKKLVAELSLDKDAL